MIFGEVIWDIYPEKRAIGGAPFNFCAHLAHLGEEAYLVSAVGGDELGTAAYEEMERHGIRTDFVSKNSFPTGSCTVELDENRVPSYKVHTDVAYDNIKIGAGDIEKIKAVGADVFYFNTLIQRSECSRESLKKILSECEFEHVFCDINIREGCFDRNSLMLCMENATIVKISEEEAHFLYDTGILDDDGKELMHSVAEKFANIKTVVYTKGKNGSEVLDTASGRVFCSGMPPKVEVVSTVGAGDCFGATFLSVYAKTSNIPAAISTATERSDVVVASYEAIPF